MLRADGFTLLETLVALGVFSLSALALLNLSGESARTAGILEERLLAGIVAENQMVAAMTAPGPAAPGKREGIDRQGGRDWRWSLDIAPSPDPSVMRLQIEVAQPGSRASAASLTYFRGGS